MFKLNISEKGYKKMAELEEGMEVDCLAMNPNSPCASNLITEVYEEMERRKRSLKGESDPGDQAPNSSLGKSHYIAKMVREQLDKLSPEEQTKLQENFNKLSQSSDDCSFLKPIAQKVAEAIDKNENSIDYSWDLSQEEKDKKE